MIGLDRNVESTAGAGLYVHIPFCSAICPYCDFAVTTGRAERREAFVRALTTEIGRGPTALPAVDAAPQATAWQFDTIYFGGGTPSILAPEQLEQILGAIRSSFDVVPAPNISMEANPEDVSASTVSAWQGLGIDTLSLGIQSFDAAELRFLGRRHDPERAVQSVLTARNKFRVVSIDLIYGLPRQSVESWEASLRTAADLEPDHVSCYQLTVHEGTPFARMRDASRLHELSDDEQAEHFLATHRVLPGFGLFPYEVSNFSRGPEHRSRHNQKYWSHTPYYGVGPSAHSFDGRRRWWNARELDRYQTALASGGSPVEGHEQLSDADLLLEALALRLRTTEGIILEPFAHAYGADLEQPPYRAIVDRWVTEGFARLDAKRLTLTPAGLAIADAVARTLAV